MRWIVLGVLGDGFGLLGGVDLFRTIRAEQRNPVVVIARSQGTVVVLYAVA